MKHLCILLVRFYRKFLSPLKGKPCCRFVPSCSEYAIQAFEKRGFFVGMILTVWRILRCNPLCEGGYDPVPEHGLRYRGSRAIPTHDTNENGCCDHNADHSATCRKDDGKGCEQEACSENIASCKEDTE